MAKRSGAEKSPSGDKSSVSPDMTTPDEPGLSFEEAMGQLQQIVNDLEDNSLGLEASLIQFERGIGLLRNCHSFLAQAEQKIEVLINFKADGEPVTAPFNAAPTAGITDPKTLF